MTSRFPYKVYKLLLIIQGSYTFITAMWGLVDIESFMLVTGPKVDIWLVKTVSVLLLAICVLFLCGLVVKMPSLPVILTAMATSAGLAAIDFYYTSVGRISWVYAWDGAAEVGFIVVWIYLLFNRRFIDNAKFS